MDKGDLNTLKVSTQSANGEAFFILKGSPSKIERSGSLDKASSVESLLQFELKFDSLKTYLDGFTTVINQHATILNGLQSELATRLIETNLYGVLQKLSTNTTIKDKAVVTAFNPLMEAPKSENTGKKQDDIVNGFCNRLELITHGFSYFMKTNAALNERCSKLESQLATKVNVDDFKKKVKKTKEKLRKKMDENYTTLDNKINGIETKLDTRMDNLDRKIDELEKHTTWRIKDCEDLLKTRINDKYVDDAIRLLEERLTKEMENITLGNTETFEKGIKELTHRLKKCEENVEDKTSSLKKNIKDIETTVTKRLEITKFEEFKKEILSKLEFQSEKILNVSRKCEPAIDQLNENMTKVNEDIEKIRQQIKNLSSEVENLNLELDNVKSRSPAHITTNTIQTVQVPVSSGGVDKEELESYFSKYRIEISKLKETVRTLEEIIHSKVDSSHFSIQISKKLDISEFEKLLSNMQSDNEKLKKLLQNNEALQSKFDKIEELIDKKIAKLRKDLDITNLWKQLKAKAEEDNVIKGFENTDKKINALSENLFALKKELEQALATLEKLSVHMFSYSDSASLSTKKINPLACLSCGHNTKIHNPLHSAVGSDGKFYRTDANYEDVNTSKMIVNGRESKNINVTYTFTQQGLVSQPKVRPQTASIRGTGKFFKNDTSVASPITTTQSHADIHHSHRPTSAKK